MTSFSIQSRTFQTVSASLFGAACLLSSTLSAHAAMPDQFARMQTQLMHASAQLERLTVPHGVVLGASTTIPVRPVCRVSIDKRSYVYGDTIKFSWKTTGGSNVELVPDTSGKDTLVMPQGEFPIGEGSVSIPASVLGNPAVVLKVTSVTGHSMICSRVVPVVAADASQKDVRLAPLNAQVIKMGSEIAKLQTNRDTIDQKISSLQTKIDELQAKIYQIFAGAGNGSTTTKAKIVVDASPISSTVVTVGDNAGDDSATFKISLDITAVDQDVYISKNYAKAISASVMSMTNATAVGTSTVVLESSADTVGGSYKINDGESETVTITVLFDAATSGSMTRLQLNSLKFGASDGVYKQTWLALPAVNFRTNTVVLVN